MPWQTGAGCLQRAQEGPHPCYGSAQGQKPAQNTPAMAQGVQSRGGHQRQVLDAATAAAQFSPLALAPEPHKILNRGCSQDRGSQWVKDEGGTRGLLALQSQVRPPGCFGGVPL